MTRAPSGRALSALFALALFLFILSLSIALPIYIRPFYYAHIEAMDLPALSGYTAQEIREAYDQILDYLTLPGREFGTGVFPHSQDGADHFADCRVLFDLVRNLILLCGGCLMFLLILQKLGKTGPYRLGKHSAAFWAAILAVVLPIVIGSLAALDFDRAFVIFHSLFFPGKTNWIFSYRTDPIIFVLPQKFFMHCALLIGAGVIFFAAAILIGEWIRENRNS